MSAMHRFTSGVAVAAVCSALMASAAIAQQSGASGSQNRGNQSAPVAGQMQIGATTVETSLVAKGIRASELIDKDVYNDRNEKIGSVDDFIVSTDGKLSVAVIDVGGFLGMGGHRVAIPVQQFQAINPRIVLPRADKESLKRLPKFEYRND